MVLNPKTAHYTLFEDAASDNGNGLRKRRASMKQVWHLWKTKNPELSAEKNYTLDMPDLTEDETISSTIHGRNLKTLTLQKLSVNRFRTADHFVCVIE